MTELRKNGTPNRDAARATWTSPSCPIDSSPPTGASTTGSLIGRSKKRPEASSFETSRSTRGRNAMRSMASRLRLTVVSVSVPPTI